MAATKIGDVFHANARFMRSVHLERDFEDPSALQSYVVTPLAKAHLERLSGGLIADSKQRAWRLTGDYGSGKSSFALAAAHALSGRFQPSTKLRSLVDFKQIGLSRRPELLPILVTGSREAMTVALLRSVQRALEAVSRKGGPPSILKKINARLDQAPRKEPTDEEVIGILDAVNQYLQFSEKGSGLLLIIDELGKFLEFAAMNPERQDIFFLQRLAEAAARSGNQQLLVVGILHQGFNAYSEHLSPAAQREWEKVAGRFEEMLFHPPLEQTVALLAEALGVRENALPRGVQDRARKSMEDALRLNWYGPGVSQQALAEAAPSLYPLHPTVVPLLVRLLSRFGQNERSLFSFLFSNEPFGLMSFVDRPATASTWFRLDNLYDYVRSSFGHRLSVQSYRSHWNKIESLIFSFATENVLELRVLKVVGLLNLLDSDGLIANEKTIALALGSEDVSAKQIDATLASLRKRHVLYSRGVAGGFCLWPHSSVNLELAYENARKAIGTPQRIAPLLSKQLETRPLVARRHYIQQGNLRYFEILYRAVGDLSPIQSDGNEAPDGHIVVFLCESDEEHALALRHAREDVFRQPNILVAVPKPLQGLSGLVLEAMRWEWVAENTKELNSDSYAAAEVSRHIASAERVRDTRLQEFLGLRQFTGLTELEWFCEAKQVTIAGARDLLEQLSTICDEVFHQAPAIKNELVNRRELSSAAAAARMRLIERLFDSSTKPFLGLDEAKAPPEMSMYLSVLQASGLHREDGDVHKIVVPTAKADPCKLRPTLDHMLDVLRERRDRKIKVSEFLATLHAPPFGVRDGLGLLLLAVFVQIYENELAFYEEGVFLRELSGPVMHRLVKKPEMFDIQYCRIAGVRSALFEQLVRALLPDRVLKAPPDVLDIVRPLCVFAANLPAYTQKTQRVSATARAVRSVLTVAKEPAPLLFEELPRACGFKPFQANGRAADKERVEDFVTTLKAAYDELKGAYPDLILRIKETLGIAFERRANTRAALRASAESLLLAVTEPTLRTLCLRFLDEALDDNEWCESVGGLVCHKPPSKWADADAEHFAEQLGELARRFRHVESMRFPAGNVAATALRVAITRADGTQLDQVLRVSAEEEKVVSSLESEFLPLLRRKDQRLALAAAARAVWKELSRYEEKN
jgi:hypothetical protein